MPERLPHATGVHAGRAPLVIALTVAIASAAAAQAPVTREEAKMAAVNAGARLAVARADTLGAFAALVTARALENPVLSLSYSKSVPTYHGIVDLPFDLPMQRRARIGAARAGRLAAQYRFAFERAGAALDADTTYTRVLAARERMGLSRRTALATDSLQRMVVSRRSAGDASELDVQLATVIAGQAANAAAADSLTYISAVLDLQIVMGLTDDHVAIVPVDSLVAPPASLADTAGAIPALAPLQVAAAQASVESARLALSAQHHSIFMTPSLTGGVEWGDPDQKGLLPTFGLAFPIPLLNRNRGPIMQARAEQARASAELTLAQVQSRNEIARARRELVMALATVERDQRLIVSANRVASMSITAYREGASPLSNVLEAQRNAREVLAQYIDDLANAWIFAAELRVITLTPATP